MARQIIAGQYNEISELRDELRAQLDFTDGF